MEINSISDVLAVPTHNNNNKIYSRKHNAYLFLVRFFNGLYYYPSLYVFFKRNIIYYDVGKYVLFLALDYKNKYDY